MDFKYCNHSSETPLASITANDTFSIKATAPTDIWRKPPSLDVFTAPVIYRSFAISSFRSAQLTASAHWHTLYDQGGILIVLPPKKSSPKEERRWVKAGIEFYQGKPFMSVVAADEWADWSLVPLGHEDAKHGRVTVEVEREREADGKLGSVLRVFMVVNGEREKRIVVREVTWAFHDVDEDAKMWVGAFAAKPTEDGGDLEVQFKGFSIEQDD